MAVNNARERYHVHQQLLRTIISEPIENTNTESNSNNMEESTIHTTESNEVMEDVSVSPEEPALEGYICANCDAQLSIGNIPTYSVAKLDYGLLSRLNELPLPPGVSGPINEPLPELTPVEKLLIAQHRPLAVTLNLSPGGTGPDGFVGHIITFVH